jgi:hypothetical protein
LSKSILKLVKDIQAQNTTDKKISHKATSKKPSALGMIGDLLRSNLTVSQENENGDEVSVGISHNEGEEKSKEENPIPDENDKYIESPRSIIAKEFNN